MITGFSVSPLSTPQLFLLQHLMEQVKVSLKPFQVDTFLSVQQKLLKDFTLLFTMVSIRDPK